MDIKKLKQTHSLLLEYMKAKGFGKVAIGGVDVMLRRLFDHEGKYISYNDFYKKFISGEGLEGSTRRLGIIALLCVLFRGLTSSAICPTESDLLPSSTEEAVTIA